MSRARGAWGYEAIGVAIDRTKEEAKWLAKTGRIRFEPAAGAPQFQVAVKGSEPR